MTVYQWLTIGLIVFGNVITLAFGSFKLGRAVEQMKDALKDHFNAELAEMRDEFFANQKSQDHNFGEVGAAMRQYIADVEKKVREVEIYARDNYVKIPEFEKAIDRLAETTTQAMAEIKKDIRELLGKH